MNKNKLLALLLVLLLMCAYLTGCVQQSIQLTDFSQLSGYDYTITRAEYNYFSDGGRLNTVRVNSMDYSAIVSQLQTIVCISQGKSGIDGLNDFITIWDENDTKWTVSLTYMYDHDTGYYYNLTNSQELLQILSKYI